MAKSTRTISAAPVALFERIEECAFDYGIADGTAIVKVQALAADIKGLSGDALAKARKAADVGYAMSRLGKRDAATRAKATKLFATKVKDRTAEQTKIYNGAAKLWSRAIGVNNMEALHANGAKRGAAKAAPAAPASSVTAPAPIVQHAPRVMTKAEGRTFVSDEMARMLNFVNTNAKHLDAGTLAFVTRVHGEWAKVRATLDAADKPEPEAPAPKPRKSRGK